MKDEPFELGVSGVPEPGGAAAEAPAATPAGSPLELGGAVEPRAGMARVWSATAA